MNIAHRERRAPPDTVGIVPAKGLTPQRATLICIGLVLAAFTSLGLGLDRFPAFYVDEPFFNASAASYVNGQPFHYVAFTQAPHTDRLWAYHGPFFFRLQVLTFSLLGVTHFAARIPSYLAAHLAVLLMCVILLRRRYLWSALVLALFWCGDRTSLEVAMGRPEGICLLFTIVGFGLLLRYLRHGGRATPLACGTSLALACGFNPAAIFNALGAVILACLLRPPGERRRGVLLLAIGSAPVIGLVLLCWAPELRASLEQFLWHLGLGRDEAGAPGSFITRILSGGHPTQYFTLAAFLVGSLIGLPMFLRGALETKRGEGRDPLLPCLGGFAASSALLYARSSTWPYYAVLLNLWVVAALAVLVESRGVGSRRWRRIALGAGCILFVAWMPTLQWKALRLREAWLLHETLDKGPFIAELHERIPADARVEGAGIYFIAALEAGLHFTPLPFLLTDPGLAAPAGTWLLLSQRYRDALAAGPRGLAEHRLVHSGLAFGPGPYVEHRYYIYAPN